MMMTENQRDDGDGGAAISVALLELAAGGDAPSPRGGASLTQVNGGDVFLIGGATRSAGCFNDVHRFDLERRTWSRVTPAATGDAFPARSGHSAVALGRRVVVFGGLNLVAGDVFNDVFVFDTHTRTWTRAAIADGEVPMPRNAHAAVLLPPASGAAHHRMLVFGGSSPDDGAFADAFVLHIPVAYDGARGAAPLRWERVTCGGERPDARELHTATLLPATATVCFSGGRGRDGGVCADLALLDTRRWAWQRVPAGEWARCSHAAGIVAGALVSFGGFDGTALRGDAWLFRAAAATWERAAVGAKDAALARFGHAFCTVALLSAARDGAASTALLVVGGMDAARDLNDVLLLAAAQR